MSAVRNYTKREAVSIAIRGATLYKENFVGRNLLFIIIDKHKRVLKLEVKFAASNYMHLTGLRPNNRRMTGSEFFNLCLDRRLSDAYIEFACDGTTQLKLSVLLDALSCPGLSVNTAGNFNNNRLHLEADKMIGNIRYALGFKLDDNGSKYVPVTLLKTDVRELVNQWGRIVATYRRLIGANKYEECVYKTKKVDWENLLYPDDWGDLPRPKG